MSEVQSAPRDLVACADVPPQTITVMVGLPGSGKSTRARRLQTEAAALGRHVFVTSRDAVRDSFAFGWTGTAAIVHDREDVVTAVQVATMTAALDGGASVIVDALNLDPQMVALWREVGRRWHVPVRFDVVRTPVDVCVARDRDRPPRGPDGLVSGRRVGAGVIRALAAQHASVLALAP